ncbi:uncharacterized protein MCYG_01456 [Microsporum canis CBS 113480]|uniref:Uncharacterized protein n=1 Tax=Arthroderma otae (strain ATCC MYA-4605 / CBS 113480) TaxID=554155 RepID=C5FH07_ARTOC|nr:uncharacterized protein MCYG_01456 [Microsporum canis CBS 113480]EEQ28637.1 predicted protein [Microsporum canis CBS 113480]
MMDHGTRSQASRKWYYFRFTSCVILYSPVRIWPLGKQLLWSFSPVRNVLLGVMVVFSGVKRKKTIFKTSTAGQIASEGKTVFTRGSRAREVVQNGRTIPGCTKDFCSLVDSMVSMKQGTGI